MLMAMLCIGDDLLSLTVRQLPQDDGVGDQFEDPNLVYVLSHTDLLTGKVSSTTFDGENTAVLAFAAWAASDEEGANMGADKTWFDEAIHNLRTSELKDTLP